MRTAAHCPSLTLVGDKFLKMKGKGCRVYPIENSEEIALAEQLVQEFGEKQREIATEMTKAVHEGKVF